MLDSGRRILETVVCNNNNNNMSTPQWRELQQQLGWEHIYKLENRYHYIALANNCHCHRSCKICLLMTNNVLQNTWGEDVFTPVFLWRRRCVHPSNFGEEKMCSPQYFCGGEDVFTPVFLVRRRCVHPVFLVRRRCVHPVFLWRRRCVHPVFLWRRRCVHPSIFVELSLFNY